MKKLLILTLISLIFFPNFTKVKAEEVCTKQNFLLSAYYSPLPGQIMYMRGTYEADLRLNGRGTNGADGTDVYMGMLAAPSKYSYGTKIKLGEMGIGTVHDRGGAIITGSDYDRIDIWMGRGEEGLSRALNWGMRFVEGEICTGISSDTLSYLSISPELPSYAKERLVAKTQKIANGGSYTFVPAGTSSKTPVTITGNSTSISKEEVFEFVKIPKDIGEGDYGENVLKLQMIFKNIGFYRDALTGAYDFATMEAVFNFQRENDVLSSGDELGAGHFGKRTKAALENYLKQLHSEIKFISSAKEGELKIGEEKKEEIAPENSFSFTRPTTKEKVASLEGLSVEEVQEILKNKNQPKNTGNSIASFLPSVLVNKTKEQILP